MLEFNKETYWRRHRQWVILYVFFSESEFGELKFGEMERNPTVFVFYIAAN